MSFSKAYAEAEIPPVVFDDLKCKKSDIKTEFVSTKRNTKFVQSILVCFFTIGWCLNLVALLRYHLNTIIFYFFKKGKETFKNFMLNLE